MAEGDSSSDASGEDVAPTAPKMGGVEKQSDDKWIVWTGGKPLADWSGLVEPNPPTTYPTQYRPESIGSSTKSQYYRTMGLTTKFSRKSDLLTQGLHGHRISDHYIFPLDLLTQKAVFLLKLMLMEGVFYHQKSLLQR